MAALALAHRAGPSLETSVFALDLASHIGTVLLIYATARFVIRTRPWIAVTAALFFALGPGAGYIAMYFGTPFFALFSTVAWSLALRLASRAEATPGACAAFAAACLLMGLSRPEGVILALLMLLALTYFRGVRASRRLLLAFALLFGLGGLLYFAWRWHYFGYPLPNPYYKKGGGHLYPEALSASVDNVLTMSKEVLLLMLTGLRSPVGRRRLVFCLIPIVGFTAVWVFLSDEMNHLMRFQYAIFPVVLLSCVFVVEGAGRRELSRLFATWPGGVRAAALACGAALLLVVLANRSQYYRAHEAALLHRDGNYDKAVALSRYRSKGYTLVTTEAGLVPLYSGWRSVDAWGLNDPWIAHHGGVTAAYLASQRPAVIEVHVPPRDRSLPGFLPRRKAQWEGMFDTLTTYAHANHFVLASHNPDRPMSVSGPSECWAYDYYVRPDIADGQAIIADLRSLSAGRR